MQKLVVTTGTERREIPFIRMPFSCTIYRRDVACYVSDFRVNFAGSIGRFSIRGSDAKSLCTNQYRPASTISAGGGRTGAADQDGHAARRGKGAVDPGHKVRMGC